ncbi:LysR family transcriptional regulator [Lactobacillus sp. DCY120]|uniref:LysR family transcriptional regulator n=1 Tax=Bombilactobacillus apium TaxID=2675299 RepID=A0A850R1D6_9LACO|nr:LysR family transcriptional regulator [Bombilactobacillus apium]NVY96170.1 LysR family transcriptional regulator [Bombilactobacillus apium]
MNFNDLKIFQAIYEIGSLNKAAEQLGYAQSNITTRLKVMETELNTKLFLRTQKGVTPTKTGNIFYSATLNIQAELAKVTTQIDQQKKTLLGSEVLISELLNNSGLVSYSHFSKIVVKRQENIVQEAANNLYDLVVTFADLNNNHNYHLQKTRAIKCNYLARESHAFANNLPVLVNSDPICAFRKRTLQDLADKSRILEIDSLQAIEMMVEQGSGISLLPCSFAETKNLVKLRTTDISLEYKIYQSK